MDYKEKVIALLNSRELSKEQKEKLEDIFPELEESEDERIRKALVELVHDTTGDSLWIDYNVHKEDAIAWLEKQKKNEKQDEKDSQVILPQFTFDDVLALQCCMETTKKVQ